MWTEQLSLFNSRAALLQQFEIPTHIANTSDAIGNIERVDTFFVPLRRDERCVRVHVPETGYQILIFRENHFGLKDHGMRSASATDAMIPSRIVTVWLRRTFPSCGM